MPDVAASTGIKGENGSGVPDSQPPPLAVAVPDFPTDVRSLIRRPAIIKRRREWRYYEKQYPYGRPPSDLLQRAGPGGADHVPGAPPLMEQDVSYTCRPMGNVHWERQPPTVQRVSVNPNRLPTGLDPDGTGDAHHRYEVGYGQWTLAWPRFTRLEHLYWWSRYEVVRQREFAPCRMAYHPWLADADTHAKDIAAAKAQLDPFPSMPPHGGNFSYCEEDDIRGFVDSAIDVVVSERGPEKHDCGPRGKPESLGFNGRVEAAKRDDSLSSSSPPLRVGTLWWGVITAAQFWQHAVQNNVPKMAAAAEVFPEIMHWDEEEGEEGEGECGAECDKDGQAAGAAEKGGAGGVGVKGSAKGSGKGKGGGWKRTKRKHRQRSPQHALVTTRRAEAIRQAASSSPSPSTSGHRWYDLETPVREPAAALYPPGEREEQGGGASIEGQRSSARCRRGRRMGREPEPEPLPSRVPAPPEAPPTRFQIVGGSFVPLPPDTAPLPPQTAPVPAAAPVPVQPPPDAGEDDEDCPGSNHQPEDASASGDEGDYLDHDPDADPTGLGRTPHPRALVVANQELALDKHPIVRNMYTNMGWDVTDHRFTPIHADRLIYSCVSPPLHPYLWQAGQQRVFGVVPKPMSHRKTIVYAGRGHTVRTENVGRRVVNEGAVLRMLRRWSHVYRIVEFDHTQHTTIDDLVTYWGGARALIGPHGGALTNVMFMPCNSLVVELMPLVEGYKPPVRGIGHMMYLQSMMLEHEYWMLPVSTPDPRGDFRVPLADLCAILTKSLGPAMGMEGQPNEAGCERLVEAVEAEEERAGEERERERLAQAHAEEAAREQGRGA